MLKPLEVTVTRLIKIAIAVFALTAPAVAWSQGKIAVVDIEKAIMQTDFAQKRLDEVRNQEDYRADKDEYDKLQAELEDLVKEFQKDSAVMSQEQQLAARKKLASMEADLKHVTGKLRQAEQLAGQTLFQEMAPKVQEVLKEIITKESIGLLLQRQVAIHADPSYSITAKVTDKLNQAAAQ